MFKKLYLLFKLLSHLDIQQSSDGYFLIFKKGIRVDIRGDLRSNANCYYFNCDVTSETSEEGGMDIGEVSSVCSNEKEEEKERCPVLV